MKKFILDKTNVQELVMENKYEVDPKTQFISRCIDGRYENGDGLPALAIAGADAGELALIFATANAFGLEVDMEKAYAALVKIVGGEKNLRCHTDHHAEHGVIFGGCGHMKQMGLTLGDYSLTQEQLDFVKTKFTDAVQRGAQETMLNGEHLEGAVLMVKGNYGIYPNYIFATDIGKKTGQVFVFHRTLVDKRHKELARILTESKAVTIPDGCDGEYLYQVISEKGEEHLLETAKRLAKDLPIFSVVFDNEGGFKVEEVGRV